MKLVKVAAILGLGLVAAAGSASAEGDAAKGEKVFNRCKACHAVGEGAKNKVGPQLNGIIGRKAGTAEGYKYSALNSAAGEAGLEWTVENITAYLEDPSKFLSDYLTANNAADKASGKSKMVLKTSKPEDRADVVAYLKTFSN